MFDSDFSVLYSTNMMKNKKLTNRDTVLRVAASLFLTKGYYTTSMDEIVAVSKVSKTNIYYYFKSKDELLATILDQIIQSYTEMIFDVVSRKDLSVQHRIEAILHLLLSQKQDYLGGCPFLTLYTQIPNDAPQIRDKVSRFFRSQISTVEQLLNEGMNNREFKDELLARPTAQFIVSAIEGALFLQHVNQDETIVEDLISSLALLLK